MILAFLVLAVLIDMGIAWVLQAVLGAFAIHISFWICFGIVFLVSWLFNRH